MDRQDGNRFDEMTKVMAGEAGTRRSVLKLLGGGALGAALAGVGLAGAGGAAAAGRGKGDKGRDEKIPPRPTQKPPARTGGGMQAAATTGTGYWAYDNAYRRWTWVYFPERVYLGNRGGNNWYKGWLWNNDWCWFYAHYKVYSNKNIWVASVLGAQCY